jgi:hypothetical protein
MAAAAHKTLNFIKIPEWWCNFAVRHGNRREALMQLKRIDFKSVLLAYAKYVKMILRVAPPRKLH